MFRIDTYTSARSQQQHALLTKLLQVIHLLQVFDMLLWTTGKQLQVDS